mgnify:CR=1 FL=1
MSGWGATGQHRTPVLVEGLPQGDLVDISIASFDPEVGCGVLVLDNQGRVWAWGLDVYGELGTLHLASPLHYPTKVFRNDQLIGIGSAFGSGFVVHRTLGVVGTGRYGGGSGPFDQAPTTTWWVPWWFPMVRAGKEVEAVGITGGGNQLVVTTSDNRFLVSGTVPFPMATGSAPAVVGGLWEFSVDSVRSVLNM